jgi:RHS repeat-associated protein
VTDLSGSGNVTTVYETANGGLDTREVDQATLDAAGHVLSGLVTTTHTAVGSGSGAATVTTTNPDNTQTVDTYANDLLTIENQLGTNGGTVTTQSFGYDALDRNTASTDAFGTTSWTLRLDGSVSGSTLPGHNPSTVTSTDPTTDIPTQATRPDSTTQNQTVNALGQVTSQSGAGLTASGYGYDPNTGQLNDLKLYPSGDPSNTTGVQETKWKYDDATGALLGKTYADGSFDTNTYSGVRLTGFSQGGKKVGAGATYAYRTTFGYNTAGEQTSSKSTDNVTQQSVTDTVNAQDDQGRPTIISGQTTDAQGNPLSSSTDVLTYANGNLTGERQAAGVTVAYDYYAVSDHSSGASPGALKAVRLVQNGQTISTTTYQYDPNTGRLQTIIVNGTSYTVGYRDQTNLISSVSGGAVALAYNYEAGTGRLASVDASHSDQVLYSAGYGYNQNDQRQSETVSQLNPDMTTTSSHNWTYGYDSQDQLTDVTDTATAQSYYHYAFDGVGNDTAFGAVNSVNEYTAFIYNGRGDLTDDGVYAYTWDAADRLTAVTAKDNSVRVTFAYDGQDRRIEKDVYSWNASTNNWTLASARKFVYDGRTIVAETDGNNALLATYGWGPAGLMSITDYRTGTPHLYSVILDGGGNVVALADTASGQVVATYRYDPWGNVTSQGSAASLCPFGYQQKYGDGEFGGYDSDRRELLSRLRRFANNDPVGIAGGSNTFLYGNDDPVNYADPSGLAPTAEETAADEAALQDQQKLLWLQETYDGWTFIHNGSGFLGTQKGSERQMTFDGDLNQVGYFSARRQWTVVTRADGSVVRIHTDPQTSKELGRDVLVESAEVQRLRVSPIWGPYMAQAADDAARIQNVAVLAKQVGDLLDTAVRIGSGPAGMVMIDAPEAITGNSMTKAGEKVSGTDRLLEGSAVGVVALGKLKRVAVLVQNVRKGNSFERAVIRDTPGAVKNLTRFVEAEIEYKGQKIIYSSIPDVMIAQAGKRKGVMIEIKNWTTDPVYLGRQLKTQLAYAEQVGYRYRMIVSPKTRLTGEAYNAIQEIGGTVEVFDRATRTFSKYVP